VHGVRGGRTGRGDRAGSGSVKETGNMKTLTIEKRPDGVFVLWMDVPGESVNTLRDSFASDFNAAFDELDKAEGLRGVVFASKKKDFIVGADVKMLQAAKTVEQASELSRGGQRSMERIANFKAPVVAAISGACMGGGLEVALACHGRVASDSSRTKLGLPECQLGLLPGAAGTQRLPRLIDIATALDMLLTGKQLDAKKARKVGLVDEVVPEPILIDVAAKHALALSDKHEKKKKPLKEWALTENPLGRKVVFDQAKKALLKKTRGNYPAQERILSVVKRGLEKGFEKGCEAEAEAFGELVMSPQAAQLMNIFFATTAMKKETGVDDPNVKPREIDRVGVLGAGLMGAGIAYVTIDRAKIPVRIKDRDSKGVASGLAHVRKELDTRVERKRITRIERDMTMAELTGTTDYSGFENIPVVIEAVFEDLALKHRVMKDVEDAGLKDVIFASNTSSIPLAKIAEGSKHPETVIGMHYFSPVEKMPLLEIIVHPKTADWVTATCVELGKKQGKTVIVVNDGVGFYTSRILGPLMNEASYVLSEGVKIEEIDAALMDWGFPVGPITLLDEVGIDVGEKVGHIMHGHFGDRMKPPPGFEKLIADKRFGRKNKRGFYLYEEGKKKKQVDESVYAVLGLTPTKEMSRDDIAERCGLQFVNEAALCFGEGILRSARDGDIGAIFGLGFPPFRGGPFRYVDTVGAKEIVRRMQRLRDRHGNRFAPAPVLVDMAESGKTFYGEHAVEPGKHKGEPARPSSTASV
jgi:3-hydroxyacyl-CoA dehydrogenase/enoyl-CoA hydratase/3-hydroxybutyryl-CoA epimerase